jgi:Flp pilus assembly protein TadD
MNGAVSTISRARELGSEVAALHAQGRYLEAAAAGESLLLLLSSRSGVDPLRSASAAADLATIYETLGRFVAAAPLYAQARELRAAGPRAGAPAPRPHPRESGPGGA